MKKTIINIALTLSVAVGLSAATISFSNFNTNTNGDVVPIVTSTDGVIDGSGVASLGYFTDDVAVGNGDFSSFIEFGSVNFATAAAFSTDSVFNDALSGNILTGSSFIGKAMYAYITVGSEALVAKSNSLTFEIDNPLFNAKFITTQNVAYLFGGDATTVNFGGAPLSGVQTSPVPEPSAYALLSGFLALSWVMVRRRA